MAELKIGGRGKSRKRRKTTQTSKSPAKVDKSVLAQVVGQEGKAVVRLEVRRPSTGPKRRTVESPPGPKGVAPRSDAGRKIPGPAGVGRTAVGSPQPAKAKLPATQTQQDAPQEAVAKSPPPAVVETTAQEVPGEAPQPPELPPWPLRVTVTVDGEVRAENANPAQFAHGLVFVPAPDGFRLRESAVVPPGARVEVRVTNDGPPANVALQLFEGETLRVDSALLSDGASITLGLSAQQGGHFEFAYMPP